MENEVNEYGLYKDKLIAALSSFEEVTLDDGSVKLMPKFREDQNYRRLLGELDDNIIVNLGTYEDDLKNDGIYVSVDKTEHITKVSDTLKAYQNLSISKQKEKEKLVLLQAKLCNQYNIAVDVNDYNALFQIGELDMMEAYDGFEFEESQYKAKYLEYLDMYLEKVSDKNSLNSFSKDGSSSLKETLVNFDEYFNGTCKVMLDNTLKQDAFNVPKFAYASEKEIENVVKKHFGPKCEIEIDPKFHEKNHLAMIKGYSQKEKDDLAVICKNGALEACSNYEINPNVKVDTLNKVNILLNAREYVTALEKVYKSYNFLRRFFNFGNVARFKNARTELVNQISEKINLPVEDCEKFFKNTKTSITYQDETYDYNKLYQDSKKLENELSGFEKAYKDSSKVNIVVEEKVNDIPNVDKDISLAKEKTHELK